MTLVNLAEKASAITNIKHFYCEVSSVQPIMWNRKIPDDVLEQEKKTKEQVQRDYWREKLHHRKDIGVYHVSDGLLKALTAGAKKWGEKIPGKKATQYNTQLPTSIDVTDFVVTDTDGNRIEKDSTIFHEYERQITRKDGQQVMAINPMLLEWKAKFLITSKDPDFDSRVILTCLQYAGTFNGMGAWFKKYGRFDVKFFAEVDYAEAIEWLKRKRD